MGLEPYRWPDKTTGRWVKEMEWNEEEEEWEWTGEWIWQITVNIVLGLYCPEFKLGKRG